MYGRSAAGHSSTTSTHHPALTTQRDGRERRSRSRRPQPTGAASSHTAASAGSTRNACSIFVRNPNPTSVAGQQQPAGAAALDRAQRRVRRADQQQHEQRVGVVEPEHQHRDGRQRRAPRRRSARRRGEPGPTRGQRGAAHRRVQQRRPSRRPSAPAATRTLQLVSPKSRTDEAVTHSAAGVLSTVIAVRRVGRAEEPRLPAHARRPARRRSRRRWPSRSATAPRGRASPSRQRSRTRHRAPCRGRRRPVRRQRGGCRCRGRDDRGERGGHVTRAWSCPLCGSSWTACASAVNGQRGSIGSRTANSVWPGLLVTLTSPPCAATTATTIARPSPVLPSCRDRDAEPRANRSKTCGSRSRGMPGPVVDHRQRAVPRSRRPSADGHRGARRRVRAGVGEQVGEHLGEPRRVAGHRDRLVGQVELPAVVRARGVRVAHGVEDQAGQVDVGALQRPSGVEPGEQQQVLDQRRHPLGLRRRSARARARRRPRAAPRRVSSA